MCRALQSAAGGAVAPMRSVQLDDSAVLRVAIGGDASAVAVSTFHGLYIADFSSAEGNPGESRRLAAAQCPPRGPQ